MKISYNWLKEYIQTDLSPEEIQEKLTLAGIEVEEVIFTGYDKPGVVIGEVMTCEQHPNADKLKVCTVNYGAEETVQVVCGAPNVAAGQKVPLATVGAELPGGFSIKKAKLRGVESYGMICALDELGLADDHSGIWVLPDDAPTGTELKDFMKQHADYILDVSITPNRPDCLSHLGVAREIAALSASAVSRPKVDPVESERSVHDDVQVSIDAVEGCPRYAARVIRNVKIMESPQWLKSKLEAVGIRPISNVVDITNFVLMEYGHPLHAFDYDKIRGNKIHVRFSRAGESFVTLDDQERKLPENTVMICDAEGPVAIGGIMGGQNSEVSPETKNVLLEAAYFNPLHINNAAKALKLSTEASYRFERGVDPNGVLDALNRAAVLIGELAEGELDKGIVDVYPDEIKEMKIPMNLSAINKLIGIDFTKEQIRSLLEPIEIRIEKENFIIPTFRPDITRTVDVAEEAARIYGFDNIPMREYTEVPYNTMVNEQDEKLDHLRTMLTGMGFYEAITNTMVDGELHAKITGNEVVPVINPISQDLSALRNTLVLSLLEVIRNNVNRQNKNVRIFEINKTFHPAGKGQKPIEKIHLTLMMTGLRNKVHWGESQQLVDFYDIKGIVETFLQNISLDNYEFIYYDNFVSDRENVGVKISNEIAGFIAKVNKKLLKSFDIAQDVYCFDIELESIFSGKRREKKYSEIGRFPGTERDVAFVLKKQQPVQEVIDFIATCGGKYLKRIEVFDRFEGKGMEANENSIAFSFFFQAPDRTLTDKEINKQFKKIIQQVTQKFKARLRT